MSKQLDQFLGDAIAHGLINASALMEEKRTPPWSVVLLSAIGAVLAALPICGIFLILFNDRYQHENVYAAAAITVCCAIGLLRIPKLPLFAEFFSICMVASAVAILWFARESAESATLSMYALCAIAIVAPQAWVRAVCSAFALLMFYMPELLSRWSLPFSIPLTLEKLYLAAIAWTLAHIFLFFAEQRTLYGFAAWGESILIGTGSMILALLAYASGDAFLISHIIQDKGLFDGYSSNFSSGVSPWLVCITILVSCFGLMRTKRLDSRWALPATAGLTLLGVVAPHLGVISLIGATCIMYSRSRLAKGAALASLWTIGTLYYSLTWPLLNKAVLLIIVALILLLGTEWIARMGHLTESAPDDAHYPDKRWIKAGLIAPAVLALIIVNGGVFQKEKLIRQGQTVFIELAPVDPRSLIQGDFMALDFVLPEEVFTHTANIHFAVAQKGAKSIATVIRLHTDSTALEKDEFLIQVKRDGTRTVLVTDAWFFKEGEADRWASAKYGEFRVTEDGKATLVGLRGPDLEPL